MSDALLYDLGQQLEKLLQAERYAAAFALGRHILRYYPRHLATYKRMGVAALAAGLVDDSIDLLQRALSIDPEDSHLWESLRDAATQANMDSVAKMAAAYADDMLAGQASTSSIAQGHEAVRERDWGRAYAAYHTGYEQFPWRVDAALGLMTALFKLDNHAEALLTARHILMALPYCLKAHWHLVRCGHILQDTSIDEQRHLRIIDALDPDGRYLTRWFDDVNIGKLEQPRAKIPAWNESERWDYRAQSLF